MIDYENLHKLNKPFFEEYIHEFKDILGSGWFILGDRVKNFENEFAGYCGTRFCCGVANGLDAMILALKSFNLQKGDEVIVPSNTYIATILAVLHAGLTPVLVEPDIRTYNINPELIEEKITAKTKVILPVHLYGKLCDMKSIMKLADKYQLKVVEDCAQAHGAAYKNQRAGSFGDYGAFSFYPTKNLGALGDGGALTCKDEKLFIAIKTMRNYGSSVKYYNEVVGYNSRLDEVQAAFLSVKLKKLDAINNHKRKLASIYLEELKDTFIRPHCDPEYTDVYHIFNIRHEKRDRLKEYLLKNGIKTEIHYPVAPNKQTAMRGILDHIHTPVAEKIHQTTLSLPVSYFHTESDIRYVTEIMNKF
jgi:dTDP-4-amino-4,6-dideoxygalactose transaminase